MKKVITILLTVLMVATLGTVNVLGDVDVSGAYEGVTIYYADSTSGSFSCVPALSTSGRYVYLLDNDYWESSASGITIPGVHKVPDIREDYEYDAYYNFIGVNYNDGNKDHKFVIDIRPKQMLSGYLNGNEESSSTFTYGFSIFRSNPQWIDDVYFLKVNDIDSCSGTVSVSGESLQLSNINIPTFDYPQLAVKYEKQFAYESYTYESYSGNAYFVVQQKQQGGNQGDQDLVYNNVAFKKEHFGSSESGVDIYYPMNNSGINPNDYVQVANENSTDRLLVFSNINYQKQQMHVGYESGYYFRPSNTIDLFVYNLKGKDLNNLSLNDNDLISFNDNDSKCVSLNFGSYDSQQKAEEAMKNLSNEMILRLYRDNNQSYSLINNNPNYVVNNNGQGKYFVDLLVNVKPNGRYYVCQQVFDEMKKSNVDYPSSPVTEIISSDSGVKTLMYYVEELIYETGKEIVVSSSGDPFNINEKLVFRNYGSPTGSMMIGNYSNSVKINLGGRTLNLGNNSIEIEANSKIYITNGTIIGNGSSVISNYGGLVLENVQVTNSSSGNAITSYGYSLSIDQKSTIKSNNGDGIVLACSPISRDKNTIRAVLMGKVNAAKKGVYINNPENKEFSLALLAVDQSVKNVQGYEPSISGGDYGIYADGKAEIRIGGLHNDESGNAYMLFGNVTGSTAIATNGGYLEIMCPTKITSSGSGKPLVQVLSTNDNNKQEVYFEVSDNQISTSNGPIIESVSGHNMLSKFSVKYQGGTSGSVFTYSGDPIIKNDSTPSIKIIGGRYVNTDGVSGNEDNIKNYIDTNYLNAQVSNLGGYEVVAKNGEPSNVTYTYDPNNESTSIAKLRNYFENPTTAQISISGRDINPNGHYVFNVTEGKNVNFNDFKLKNIEFNVNLDDNNSMFVLWNGDISNSGTIINLIDGTAMTASTKLTNSGSGPVVSVSGGKFVAETHKSDIIGKEEGVRVDAPNGAKVSIASTVTAPMAINVVNNIPGDDYGLWIERVSTNDIQYNVLPKINGKINLNNCTLILREGTVDSTSVQDSVAISASGNANIIVEDDNVEVKGNSAAIELKGDARVQIKGGYLSGFDVIRRIGKETQGSSNQNDPTVLILGKPYLATTDKANGAILRYSGSGFNNEDLIAESGFYNVPVSNLQFNNLNRLMSQDNYDEGMYKCIQYQPITSDYPYTIVYDYTKYANQNGGAALVVEDSSIEIEADTDQLHEIKDEYQDGEWTVMVADEIDATEAGSGFGKYDVDNYLDIYINDIVNINSVKRITETDDYQFMVMEVGNGKANKTVIFHKHANNDPKPMDKVTTEEGNQMKGNKDKRKECYYVSGDNKVTVVTKQFSTFALSIGNEVVPTGTNDVLVSASGKAIDLNISSSGSATGIDTDLITASIQNIIDSGSGSTAKMDNNLVEFLEAHKSESGLSIDVEIIAGEPSGSDASSVSGKLGTSANIVAMKDIKIKVTMSCGGENVNGYITQLYTTEVIKIDLPDDAPTASPDSKKNINYFVSIKHGEEFLEPISVSVITKDGHKYVNVPSDKFSVYTVYYTLTDKPVEQPVKRKYSAVKTEVK